MKRCIQLALLVAAALLAACDPCDGGNVLRGDALLQFNEDAEALQGVQCITGDLQIGAERIVNNGQISLDNGGNTISSLFGLSELVFVEGNLFIEDADSLNSLNGLDSLEYIGRPVRFEAESFFQRGSLIVDENGSLSSVDGLRGVTNVGGNAIVSDNPNLPELAVQVLFSGMKVHGTGGIEIRDNGS